MVKNKTKQKTKSAKPISAVFIWETVLLEPRMLHHFNYFDVYIYIPLVLILPCLRCLLVIVPFLVPSSPSPPEYRIYMDTTVLYVRI